MSIFFSRQCEYALQSIIYLAQKKQGEMTTIKEISSHLNIPFHFLGKIFQKLSHKGLLHSMKGVSGGFWLAKPAEEIVLMDIVVAIDGSDIMNLCVLGYTDCDANAPCAMHTEWKATKEGFFAALAKKNILDVAKEIKKEGYKA
ncbi:MAG: Rrf2 family transcriptional regulator [Bacteroidetes bacterium]|jgi:Rrf2 family iron-sulfur cluster assembly transcriptional regulator|nr:Rrf2 family transcriptional regulator [Bacteroidota bacterium]